MKKRIQYFLSYYEEKIKESLSKEEKERERAELLVQINFFQHERLVHLIVTVLFALLSVGSIFITLCVTDLFGGLLILDMLFFTLLIPYIAHYYQLENGVQKLYEYYDRLQ